MSNTVFYVEDLSSLAPEVPADSSLSRTFYNEGGLKGIIFAFATGQELSEHTSVHPAILHFLSGTADLTLGTESKTAGPGTWVQMPARLPHSIVAKTPVVMLLLMLPI
jgi:quercetin dioxygenase-like cupin family protein